MSIWANELRLHILNVLNMAVTDILCLNQSEIMSKLIWQLYNENLISEEVANLLLDKHYNRLENKKYR